jgi:hypothetical protein
VSDARTASHVDDLLVHAASAHRDAHGDPQRALAAALDAGDAFASAKTMVDRGTWAATLRRNGIAPSTAFVLMRLAAHRSLIEGAHCTSIRQARRLIATHRGGDRVRRGPSYEEGYRAGYAQGKHDGYSHGWVEGADAASARPPRRRAGRNGDGAPPSKADLKWALRRLHPDVVEAADSERAHRVAAWLNAVNNGRTTA